MIYNLPVVKYRVDITYIAHKLHARHA